MTSTTTIMRTLGISSAFMAAGGILSLSIFSIPPLLSLPPSQSLPQIRWIFSRGSHVFPTAAILSSTTFIYLSLTSLPAHHNPLHLLHLLHLTTNSHATNGYLFAAILSFSIAPFTSLFMIPTNFALIEKNEELGGARSERSAKESKVGGKSAEESVAGKGDVSEMSDLSGPMRRTEREGSREDEKAVRELLGRFKWLNYWRALLIGCGGVVGLVTALG